MYIIHRKIAVRSGFYFYGSIFLVTCVSPYALSPVTGSCVNTLTDLNNCGSIGNVCGSNYTSCSAGVCSTVPVVQLSSPAVLWCGATNGSSDDAMFNLSLPFSIRVYSKTTNKIQLTTNGVSIDYYLNHLLKLHIYMSGKDIFHIGLLYFCVK